MKVLNNFVLNTNVKTQLHFIHVQVTAQTSLVRKYSQWILTSATVKSEVKCPFL